MGKHNKVHNNLGKDTPTDISMALYRYTGSIEDSMDILTHIQRLMRLLKSQKCNLQTEEVFLRRRGIKNELRRCHTLAVKLIGKMW